MEVIQGGKAIKIAGAAIGEGIIIHLLSGKVERAILNDVTRVGIEGFNLELIARPLTFYPYNTIVKIVKLQEDKQG